MKNAFVKADILLPKDRSNMEQWAVIACDQFTQDKDYWSRCAANTKGNPSTLNIIFPEVYLNEGDKAERIEKINRTMKEYRESVFDTPVKSFIYIERTTEYGHTRCGLIGAIDLEAYEWKPFSTALIRSTEQTIIDRIPPRVAIRKNASVETPHIMLLADDARGVLVDTVGKAAKKQEPLYDTDLMEKGGHITGWALAESDEKLVQNALDELAEQNRQPDGSTFLFAAGDGNHSLATAKAVWDELKTSVPEADRENHPCRYALVEIVSIYDKGLTFEPIHRVLFGAEGRSVAEELAAVLEGTLTAAADSEELEKAVGSSKADFGIEFMEDGELKCLLLHTAIKELAVSRLQPALDKIMEGKNWEIDFIHGADEVLRLSRKPESTGILLPPIAKDSFFQTIATNGPLPRKSFSMGEATEKRYYLECRSLVD